MKNNKRTSKTPSEFAASVAKALLTNATNAVPPAPAAKYPAPTPRDKTVPRDGLLPIFKGLTTGTRLMLALHRLTTETKTDGCITSPEKKPKAPKVPKAEIIGEYPPELHAAFPIWRNVLETLKSEDVREKFPPGKIFIPSSGVGTKGAAWRAWQKRTAQICQGQQVTNADVLAAIELWASRKIALAMAGGESASAKALPAMINAEDFDDAIVRAVKTRTAPPLEIPDAS